jgi:hypothetical protein
MREVTTPLLPQTSKELVRGGSAWRRKPGWGGLRRWHWRRRSPRWRRRRRMRDVHGRDRSCGLGRVSAAPKGG